jgi:hypothetical protein
VNFGASQLIPGVGPTYGRVATVSVSRASLTLLFTFAALAASSRTELQPSKPNPTEPADVSILQLIATPTAYHGKRVRLIGFCNLEFEGNGLYLHREDLEQRIHRNALWLDVEGTPKQRELSGHYVLVEATFDAEDHGHMSLFSGSLTGVSRMQRWPVGPR